MGGFSVQKFFYRQWTKNSSGTNTEVPANPEMASVPIRSYSGRAHPVKITLNGLLSSASSNGHPRSSGEPGDGSRILRSAYLTSQYKNYEISIYKLIILHVTCAYA